MRISISYNSPSDFSLPSPPFYRPASSVKFVCLVYGATRPVQYHWTSTATAFVQQQTSWTVTINNMDVSDVGIYTCSVTDSDGDTVSATTTIQLSGEKTVSIIISCIQTTIYSYSCSIQLLDFMCPLHFL